MGVWGFAKDVAKWAWSILTVWRRWGQEDRAEIEKTYRDELSVLQDELNDAESGEDKTRIKTEIQRIRTELRSFHRARRELLLSKSLVQRMTPTGAITAGEPALPQADREVLEAAASVVARLEPPKTFADHFLQGNAFYAAGDYDRALEQYNHALELRPDDPDTLNNRGMTLALLEHHEDALLDLNRYLGFSPDDPIALYNRGCILSSLKRHEEAVADYSRSLELSPRNPATLNNRGAAFHHLERFDEALADYSSSLELRPEDATTLSNRSLTLARLRRYDEALAGFNRALQLQPGDAEIIYNRAGTLSLMARLPEAFRELKEAISRDAKCRDMAREDQDFENLRSDPTLGPEFERLVAEPED